MLATQTPLLIGVGVVAGIVSTVASVASIVSYPALLAIGLPPLSANVTNTVALAFTGAGAAAGSRPELAGQARRVWRLGMVTACGGATGAALLLLTPPRTFEIVAPGLIAIAALLILLRPVGSDLAAGGGRVRDRLLTAGVFTVAIYTGYFGAAGGILMNSIEGALFPWRDWQLVRAMQSAINRICCDDNAAPHLDLIAIPSAPWTRTCPRPLIYHAAWIVRSFWACSWSTSQAISRLSSRTKNENHTTRIIQWIVKGTGSSRAPNPPAGE